MTFTYVRHILSAPLNAYVDCFFYLDGSMTYPREKSLPDPSTILIINFGGAVQMSCANQSQPCSTWAESWWMGPWSKYHLVNWPEHVHQIGIDFRPGGAYPFLRLPISELHNQYVSLDDIWGRQAAEIREQLYAAPTVEEKFALLEQILLARLCETPQGLNVVQYAAGKIVEHYGLLSIKGLSDDIGISQNHLLTQFNRMVGFSPKELSKHYRLLTVLHSIDPTQPIDWTQVALHFGYYDLSHLNKDFVAFIGLSPTRYLELRRQKHHAVPLNHHIVRLLPID